MFQAGKLEKDGPAAVPLNLRELGTEPTLLARLKAAKRAFTTRRMVVGHGLRLQPDGIPLPGDLILATVDSIGHHRRLESPHGRRVDLYEGDEIIVAYGERYAPDQFEAVIPADLQPCELVAGGGVAGRVISRHGRSRRPTRISPVGLLCDASGVVNLARFALPQATLPPLRPRVIAVAGTAMNAGKTTTASALIHGLTRARLNVCAAKITGTGSGNDVWSMVDAGARQVLDFTDMGHVTTVGLSGTAMDAVAESLIAHCAAGAPDVIVVEIADGLMQRETAGLLSSATFRGMIDGVLFAAGDALGAMAGCEWLERRGHHVLGVSGLLTASPLAMIETTGVTDLPVLRLADLKDPLAAPALAFAATSRAA